MRLTPRFANLRPSSTNPNRSQIDSYQTFTHLGWERFFLYNITHTATLKRARVDILEDWTDHYHSQRKSCGNRSEGEPPGVS